MSETNLDELRKSRQSVYGDPQLNHRGIAMQWAPMLQPWAEDIAQMKPLPEHVIALLMTLLKVNRMRITFKQDNFDDARVYMQFAEEWQEAWHKQTETK